MKISKKVVRMGIDLGKNTFHVFGVDESGSTVRPPDLWDFNMTSASKNSDKAHKFHGD